MITEIGKKVKVGVVFEGLNIKPKWFIWENRKIEVEKVEYFWKSNNGVEEIINFSIVSGSTLYELSFNKVSLVWKLEKLEVE